MAVTERTCSVEDCRKPPRRPSSPWCAMHYHRWYRHGSVEMVASSKVTATPNSVYKSVSRPRHPLAPPCGRVYVHRMVLFDAIGPGSHACHWCGRLVTWLLPIDNPDTLEVDHLNGVKDDNRIDNLVVSCGDCNTTRGAQARHEQLLAEGYWSNHDTIASLRSPGRRPPIVAISSA